MIVASLGALNVALPGSLPASTPKSTICRSSMPMRSLGLLLAGRDRYWIGRRRALAVGYAVFGMANLVAVVADSVSMVVVLERSPVRQRCSYRLHSLRSAKSTTTRHAPRRSPSGPVWRQRECTGPVLGWGAGHSVDWPAVFVGNTACCAQCVGNAQVVPALRGDGSGPSTGSGRSRSLLSAVSFSSSSSPDTRSAHRASLRCSARSC